MYTRILTYHDHEDGGIQKMMVVEHYGEYYTDQFDRNQSDKFYQAFLDDKGTMSEWYNIEVDLDYMVRVEPYRSLYSVSREYGGPEEGGWYYTHYEYLFQVDEKYIHDEDEVVIIEFFERENQTRCKPIYC